MKVRRFVSDLDRIMSLIYDDVPLPPREEKPREFPVWEERARDAIGQDLSARKKTSRKTTAKEPPVLEALRTLKPVRNETDHAKQVKPEIRIDLDALEKIRSDSEYTMERLMTEEERGTELFSGEGVVSGSKDLFVCETSPSNPEVPCESRTAASDPAASSENDFAPFGLDAVEYSVLKCLLNGTNLDEVNLKGKILSVLIDSINEKLFDEVGDLVIENESFPELVEDYREELMEMFIK